MSETLKNMCVEFFLKDKTTEFECNSKEITQYMAKNNLLPKSSQTVIVFDLHNVLDKINNDTPIKNGDDSKLVICCSYIGYRNERLKERAKIDMLRRIKNGQIDYGILVFKRGKRIKKKKRIKGKSKELTNRIGSKDWFCKKVNCNIFFDDGLDHIESVKEYTSAEAILVSRDLNEEELTKLINEKITTLTGGKYYFKYLKYKTKYLKLKKNYF